MGSYKGPEYYDHPDYMQEYFFEPPWHRNPRYPRPSWIIRFKKVIEHIQPDQDVLDLGCGIGVLAAVLWHEKAHRARYVGVDFSKVSIEIAVEGNRKCGHQRAEFLEGEALDPGALIKRFWPDGGSPVIVCTEMLEHVKDDLSVIEHIPSGTRCVVTVPSFDAEAHLRWFPSPKHVIDRYSEYFDQFEISRYPCYTVVMGMGIRQRRYVERDNLFVGVRR